MGLFSKRIGHAERRPPMSVPELAERFVLWIERNAPGASAVVVPNPDDANDAWVDVTLASGLTVTAYLDNLRDQYIEDGATWNGADRLFQAHYERMLQIERDPDPAEATLMPMLKTAQWLAGLPEGEPDDVPLHAELAGDLIVTWVDDFDGGVRFVMPSALAERGLTREQLAVDAVTNLATRMNDQLSVRGGDGLYMIVADGTYEATCALLLDRIVPQLPLTGEAIVAVPARDLLLIADGAEPAALERMAEITTDVVTTGSHPLTDRFHVFRDGGLHPLER